MGVQRSCDTGAVTDTLASLAIVIVDDDDAARALLKRLLAAWGARVTEFASAEEGLAYLRLHGADLLITDLELGKMDGADLVAALQRSDVAIPIVMVSGSGAVACRDRLAAVAAPPILAVIDKPIRLASLRDIIEALQRPSQA